MLSWRMHKLRLRSTAAAVWLVVGFVFTLLLAAVAPLALGMHTYTVRSGSMEPAIATGDLVITRTIPPTEVGRGDIVTFKDPQGSGALITHRVRAVRAKAGKHSFVTRGDANNAFERWSVPSDGSIGEVAYRVPLLGYALAPVASKHGQIGLIVAPAVLLCALGLVRIWAPGRLGARPGATSPEGA